MADGSLQGNIWIEEHAGDGPISLLLLHGLGANAAVWDRLLPHVKKGWHGPCIVPDLRGHGRSLAHGAYSFGTFASDLADVVSGRGPVAIIGHSLGGALGAFLATGWFGVDVRSVLALSVKTNWSVEELAKFKAISEKPARSFDTKDEARIRFLRSAGLEGLVGNDDRVVDLGIARAEGGDWKLAADPRSIGSTGPQLDVLVRSAISPVRFATGANDLVAPLRDMTPFDPAAASIEGAGHNVHVEQPGQVWELFRQTCNATDRR
jgi:pimeloyl-ACP methyl ester carboxylesterase